MARYKSGGRGAQTKTSATKTYGRSKRPVRYPLMPDGMKREQAIAWYERRYGTVRVGGKG